MIFNKFIWSNYKESKNGQEAINLFKKGTFEQIAEKFLDSRFVEINHEIYQYEEFTCIKDIPEKIDSVDASKVFFKFIIENGFILDQQKEIENERIGKMLRDVYGSDFDKMNWEGSFIFIEQNSFDELLNQIISYSYFLFKLNPNYFFPYFFYRNFLELQKICDAFNIDLPNVPLRKNKLERLNYYIQLCDIFLEFRQANNLNPFEFCAFLYDFAPNYIGKETLEKLPEPSNIWMCGADKEDYIDLIKADNTYTSGWQGNEDTKKGDIIIMYCRAPNSRIEFICRAVNDGIRDPFYYYYQSINVGHIQRIEPILYSEIKQDEYLKNLGIVRQNFQGVNGKQLNNEDYQRILQLTKEKGQDVSVLPQLSTINYSTNTECKNERDVEIQLVEPFLSDLNFQESDWIRQLPVRMGRGERNYPDYVFFAETKKGYEKGKMILETKFCIKNNRELEETFQQAHSYALRLGASVIVLCDKDFLYFYLRKNGSFDRTKYQRYNWQAINNPDIFNNLKNTIGKNALLVIKN